MRNLIVLFPFGEFREKILQATPKSSIFYARYETQSIPIHLGKFRPCSTR